MLWIERCTEWLSDQAVDVARLHPGHCLVAIEGFNASREILHLRRRKWLEVANGVQIGSQNLHAVGSNIGAGKVLERERIAEEILGIEVFDLFARAKDFHCNNAHVLFGGGGNGKPFKLFTLLTSVMVQSNHHGLKIVELSGALHPFRGGVTGESDMFDDALIAVVVEDFKDFALVAKRFGILDRLDRVDMKQIDVVGVEALEAAFDLGFGFVCVTLACFGY